MKKRKGEYQGRKRMELPIIRLRRLVSVNPHTEHASLSMLHGCRFASAGREWTKDATTGVDLELQVDAHTHTVA